MALKKMDMRGLYVVMKHLGPTRVTEQGVEVYEFIYQGHEVQFTVHDGELEWVTYGEQ